MKKIMVFGTFDLLHPGHINFFNQAKKLAPFLIVVVARDKYVLRAKSKLPKHSEVERTKKVRKIDTVNKAILGSVKHDFYRTIRTYKPDILALGYDQKPRIRMLKRDLKRHRLKGVKVIRLRPHRPEIYKSSKLL